jgi:hypothetical protein
MTRCAETVRVAHRGRPTRSVAWAFDLRALGKLARSFKARNKLTRGGDSTHGRSTRKQLHALNEPALDPRELRPGAASVEVLDVRALDARRRIFPSRPYRAGSMRGTPRA